MTMAGKQFDIAMVGDFRFPGGTSSCMAQEIKAQARAGYRTALVQVPAPVLKKRRAFNPSIMACLHAGQATVVPVEEPLSARLVLIHHPLVFAQRPERSPRIDASVKRLIVHQPPADGTQAEPRYDVRAVQEVVRGLFGEGIQWAPVGPLVRENLPGPETGIEVTDSDWFNLIDVDEWAVDRSRFVGDRPVIGRHGRPEWHKWPASAEVILAAYPRDERFCVKILGGAEAAERIIGERPSNWHVYPFGAMHPRKFLREIDFFVYYHHPEWIEAFGRTILEALASGCPVIVPRHFEALFEDACLYADPSEVRAIVEALYADPSRSREIGSRGQTFVRERFGLEVHQRRVRALIGDPSSPAATTVASVRPQRRRVLFLTSNGEGMGHLTRMMAIARRAREDIEPIFATLSLALKVVREAGSFAEFIPRHPEWHWSIWNPFLERRLLKIIDRYGAEAVVFDGNAPYQGVISARQAAACPFVWVRRAMWKIGEGKTFLERSRHFDLVIEPGEFAAEFDRGLTVAHRSDILCVPPIVMLDRSEALGREEARAALGLDPGAQTVLLQLGSDNTNDIASPAWIAAERLLREPDTAVVVAEWLISRRPLSLPKGVRRVRIYPLSRYLNAFDFAISAAGYNSFHELVAFGIPSIFVPMDKPSEDQSGRTRYAEQVGAGLHLQPFTEQGLDRCLETMRRPEARRDMVAACTALFPGNGAGEAMEAIERLIGAGSAAAIRAEHSGASRGAGGQFTVSEHSSCSSW